MHIGDHNNSINLLDLMKIYRKICPTITTVQALQIHTEKTKHILVHKTRFNAFQIIKKYTMFSLTETVLN